jgi:hypothetical protein
VFWLCWIKIEEDGQQAGQKSSLVGKHGLRAGHRPQRTTFRQDQAR